MIVGITGGIGSGKTTACRLFQSLGIPIINADEVAHKLLEDLAIRTAIIHKFGSSVLRDDNTIDRSKVKDLIFNSPLNRVWLEELLHPAIKNAIGEEVRLSKSPYYLIEIPLLFETEMEKTVDRILTIDCPEPLQIERVIRRDNISQKLIESIIATQVTRKVRLANSHDIIDNTGDIEALRKLVIYQHNYYLDLAASGEH